MNYNKKTDIDWAAFSTLDIEDITAEHNDYGWNNQYDMWAGEQKQRMNEIIYRALDDVHQELCKPHHVLQYVRSAMFEMYIDDYRYFYCISPSGREFLKAECIRPIDLKRLTCIAEALIMYATETKKRKKRQYIRRISVVIDNLSIGGAKRLRIKINDFKRVPMTKRMKRIVSRIPLQYYTRLTQIVDAYGFKSVYSLMNCLAYCFLRVADGDNDCIDEPLPDEVKRMFELRPLNDARRDQVHDDVTEIFNDVQSSASEFAADINARN